MLNKGKAANHKGQQNREAAVLKSENQKTAPKLAEAAKPKFTLERSIMDETVFNNISAFYLNPVCKSEINIFLLIFTITFSKAFMA